MRLDRRAFVKGAGLAIVGSATSIGLLKSPAAAERPKRKAIGKLTKADGSFENELQVYHDALARLKSEQPVLWTQLSRFHDIFCTGAGADEVHGNWRFLAWHRAYLLTYERVLREVTGDNAIAIPYWDWFDSDTLPSAFTVGALNHPQRNLNSGRAPIITGADRGDRESDNYDAQLPFGPRVRGRPLSFFGWKGPNGQHGRPEFYGHGGMHNWVGGLKIVGGRQVADGDMADLDRAANDPCFFSHHGNIDRIWEVWKTDVFGGTNDWERSIPSDWKLLSFEFDFGGGRSYTYNSMDLINTETAKDADGVDLGYTYDNIQPRHPLPPRRPVVSVTTVSSAEERAAPPTERPILVLDDPAKSEPVRIPLGDLLVGDKSRTTSSVPVTAPERMRATEILDEAKSLSAGPEATRPFASAVPGAEGRAVVRVGRMRLPPRNVQLRFFLNNPAATLDSTGEDSGFIGSFNFIPSSQQPETVEGFELEITDDVGDKLKNLENAQVTVVPSFAGENDEKVEIDDMVLEVR